MFSAVQNRFLVVGAELSPASFVNIGTAEGQLNLLVANGKWHIDRIPDLDGGPNYIRCI